MSFRIRFGTPNVPHFPTSSQYGVNDYVYEYSDYLTDIQTTSRWEKIIYNNRTAINHQHEDTALQAGRSRVRFPVVSMEFFFEIILPAGLWSWYRLSLQKKWVPVISHGGKGGRCVGLTLPLNLVTLTSWDAQGLSRPIQGLTFTCT